MLIQRILRSKTVRNLTYTFIRNTQQAASDIEIIIDTKLPANDLKEAKREPFMKNLFYGKFDTEFLAYPEPQNEERHKEFNVWLKQIEKYMQEISAKKNLNKQQLFEELRRLDVFRARVPQLHRGIELMDTELVRLMETISRLPWLGTYVNKACFIPTDVITKYGTKLQQQKYLFGIGNRDFIPTLCITEATSGPNLKRIYANAVLSESGEHYVLNGEKTFVVNGDESNLFLVFAQCGIDSLQTTKNSTLSLLLVERDFGGITTKLEEKTLGQQEVRTSTVTFKDTIVPKENKISDSFNATDILIDILAPGNRNIVGQAIAILRNFLNLLIAHVLDRKHLDRNMIEFENIQSIITGIAADLYAMESMAYLTTGMIDCFDDQDVEMEKAITESFCSQACVNNIYKGLQVIGARSYLKGSPYTQVFLDALALTTFDGSGLDDGAYISLLGLQHSGKQLQTRIKKARNPLQYPDYILSKIFSKEPRLHLHLDEYVHPSLKMEADLLETCVSRLMMAVELLLTRHGSDVSQKHMALDRLSEAATRVYLLTAALSRASRSYCVGTRNADQELYVAGLISHVTEERLKVLMEEIAQGDFNGDPARKEISLQIFNSKQYIYDHPMNRIV